MSESVSRQYMRMNKIILAFFVLISAAGGLAYSQKTSDKTSVPQPEQKNVKSGASGTEVKRESQDEELSGSRFIVLPQGICNCSRDLDLQYAIV